MTGDTLKILYIKNETNARRRRENGLEGRNCTDAEGHSEQEEPENPVQDDEDVLQKRNGEAR
jgi:hypothetical protein